MSTPDPARRRTTSPLTLSPTQNPFATTDKNEAFDPTTPAAWLRRAMRGVVEEKDRTEAGERRKKTTSGTEQKRGDCGFGLDGTLWRR